MFRAVAVIAVCLILSVGGAPQRAFRSSGVTPPHTFRLPGATMKVLVSGARTNGASATLEATISSGAGPPAHIHTREDETIVVTRGHFRFWRGAQAVDGGPGTVVYLPRNEAHQFINVGRTPGNVIITIVPAGLEQMFIAISQHRLTVSKDQAELLSLGSQYGITYVPALVRRGVKTSDPR